MHLLDVNILISLFDTSHINHSNSLRWFEENYPYGWATCPITENGFVRIISQPNYKNVKITTPEAINLLNTIKTKYGIKYKFFTDNLSFNDNTIFDKDYLKSNSVTDTYLIALAYKNSAKFVTYDRACSTIGLQKKKADVILYL